MKSILTFVLFIAFFPINAGAFGIVHGYKGLSDSIPAFTDDFNRSNRPLDGDNDWDDKPGTWAIDTEKLVGPSTGSQVANLVTRPSSEAWLDGEASIELTSPAGSNLGYMFVNTRVINIVDGTFYTVYTSNIGPKIVISRFINGAQVDLLGSSTYTYTVGETYKLELKVSGTNPVSLEANLYRDDTGSWANVATVTTTDNDANKIITSGPSGFSQGALDNPGDLEFDNFYSQSLD